MSCCAGQALVSEQTWFLPLPGLVQLPVRAPYDVGRRQGLLARTIS